MNKMVNIALGYAMIAQAQESEMQEEFTKRAEEAKQLYWEACKYPRKKKKKIRKQAKADYWLYIEMAKPVIYSF